MKLLYCKSCGAVFSLDLDKRECPGCSDCGGHYLPDKLNAVWWGNAIPLGFANFSFVEAMENQPDESPGLGFVAFVIEKNCKTFKQIGKP